VFQGKRPLKRCISPSLTGYFLEARGIPSGVEVSKYKRAKTARAARLSRFSVDDASTVFDDIDWTEPVVAGAMASSRRSSIVYILSFLQ
jgi:hypothetical protein